MSTSGAVTLGDIGDRLPMLEVGCTPMRTDGRLRVDRLIQRYGRGAKLQKPLQSIHHAGELSGSLGSRPRGAENWASTTAGGRATDQLEAVVAKF
jgi:hypothetical protein